MVYAILMDTTKCTGCRGCQVACKSWYELPPEKTSLTASWTNPPDLSSNTWTHVRLVEMGEGEGLRWTFYRWACMHCDDPACARVCPTKAINKFAEGPVVIDQSRCVGCRYCIQACPFQIPRRDPEAGIVYKCTMCPDRITQGEKPNCVETCPTGALEFGEKDEMRAKARERAAKVGGYVYGEKEVGGTSTLIVTVEPPEALGLPKVPMETSAKWVTDMLASSLGLGMPVALALGAAYYLKERREIK